MKRVNIILTELSKDWFEVSIPGFSKEHQGQYTLYGTVHMACSIGIWMGDMGLTYSFDIPEEIDYSDSVEPLVYVFLEKDTYSAVEMVRKQNE